MRNMLRLDVIFQVSQHVRCLPSAPACRTGPSVCAIVPAKAAFCKPAASRLGRCVATSLHSKSSKSSHLRPSPNYKPGILWQHWCLSIRID